jgi:hypothetical protein
VLRGKDVDTGEVSVERREQQFAILKEAQARVLDLTRWHLFLGAISNAGFRSAELISSQNALLYAYAFYLRGRDTFKVPEHNLQRLIGCWFFFTSLTGRYTTSPESVMDGDLNRLKDIADGNEFIAVLESLMASALTNDYWTITLPAALETSSARNPELFAYIAAQVRLGVPVLFSDKLISHLLDPVLKPPKRPLERHHLFPRAYLVREGITDLKVISQQANMALLEWPDNLDIGDAPPSEYVPKLRQRFRESAWRSMHDLHALPEGWETMRYEDFLTERRKRMGAIIRRGFDTLAKL